MSTQRFHAWPMAMILTVACQLTACKKAEESAAPPPPAAPQKVSVEATPDAPPPPPTPDAPAATAGDAAAPAAAPQPEGTAVSVYDTGTPAQKAAAAKSRRNLAWLNAIKSGNDAAKQKAKREIDNLPPAEKAEFVEMTKMYGIPFP